MPAQRPMMNLILALLFLLALSAQTALADGHDEADHGEYAAPGAYASLSVVYGNYANGEKALEDELAALGYLNSDGIEDTVGGDLVVGYRNNDYLAFEGQFTYLSETSIENGGVGVAHVDSYIATVNARLYPLTGQFQPYAVVGAGAVFAEGTGETGISADISEESFALRVGAGLDYYLTEMIALNAAVGYISPIGSLDYYDIFTVGSGVMFKF